MNKGAYYISDRIVLNGVVNTDTEIPQSVKKFIEVKTADGDLEISKMLLFQ